MSGLRKVWAITVKEMRQIGRDRRTLMILLFVPGFFLLLYGYALNFDIRNIRLAVKDQDRSTESRELIAAFVYSGYFDLVAYVDRDEEIVHLIDRNQVRAALVIPPRFGRDAATGRRTSVQVIVDGDNANTATTVVGYALTLVSSVSAR
jgi:ABC-2 type transport system permease protein